jgi:hypothetical protein
MECCDQDFLSQHASEFQASSLRGSSQEASRHLHHLSIGAAAFWELQQAQ